MIDMSIRNLMLTDDTDVIILTDVKSRKIIDHNSALLGLFGHQVIGKTLCELIDETLNPLIVAELRYCEYVESECIATNRCTISIEQFSKSMYFCFRLIFPTLENDKRIITILKKMNLKMLSPNQIILL